MLLVRHARAGDRADWTGDDRLRPLDERGERQAQALVELLDPHAVSRIVSSPYRRCLQTVEPLADARGLEIEAREELGEERQSADGAVLLQELLAEDAVVCVHGGAQRALLPPGASFKKGSVWEVASDGTPLRHLRPPA